MAKVNLDALIPREDFEVKENINPGKKKDTLSIEDFKADSFFFQNLRKPDFQRETNEWDSKKICAFIQSFVEGDLIPAVILWRSTGGHLFVIDGSHRFSALFAWVNDDYGDGKISKEFYEGVIPDEQLKFAEETRKLVNKIVCPYDDLRYALTNTEKFKPEIVQYARNLSYVAIQLQWVEGDASKAESSFLKINQQAAPINNTELQLIKSRTKPNSIAARAIIRSGTGHKYWSSFSNEIQDKIEEIAKEINQILFEPKLHNRITTSDLPMGGKLYSNQTLSLIFDFVNVVNDIELGDNEINDDKTDEATIKFLSKVRKISRRLNSNDNLSLGLHPIVYFYSQEGRYRTVAFISIVDFVIELDKRNKINDFISVREKFEDFLIAYDYLSQQIYYKYKSVHKSYKHISKFFQKVINYLKNGLEIEAIINEIISKDFNYLTLRNTTQETNSSAKDFTTSQKSRIFIIQELPRIQRCKICGGLIHRNSISIDHIQRKQDGGLATLDNGQITHPYCNTGYKN
ncbi:HNH endonuclease [Sphaerospermopsis aphanizomenoides BCCUSP55]|nr:HNH endonuclease [Sphaerospermopsis aphanizomenoides BCCUSP55]